MFADVKENYVVCGHSHLPMDRKVGRWHIINPGTVGVPLTGECVAAYAVLDGNSGGWNATFHQVPFDVSPILAELERLQLVDHCGVEGKLIIREFETHTMWLHPFTIWHQATHPGQPFTDAHYTEFLTIDPRPFADPPYRPYIQPFGA